VGIAGRVKMDKEMAAIWKIFDEMHVKMKEYEPQKIGKLIDEAVKEARKQQPMRNVRRR
jgi:hypothetical protein